MHARYQARQKQTRIWNC